MPAGTGKFVTEGSDADISVSIAEAEHQLALLQLLSEKAERHARLSGFVATISALIAVAGFLVALLTVGQIGLRSVSFDTGLILALATFVAALAAVIANTQQVWRTRRQIIDVEAERLFDVLGRTREAVAKISSDKHPA